ncbi:hypothetical protein LL912_15830 [Niabella sp. CC-SYL272]|uniref:hypothetical protein n=1 Tax=Niabella agricola TaxID=2891571 RepID=UPI001F2B1CA4|nr:hypothetical protein [Niabella agricola]MCF3110254.1 hypothetical protein [Niabella agricola]
MNNFLPAHMVFALLVLLFQTYILFYITLFLMRRLKMLKLPYNGMDHAELLIAVTVILGVMFLSVANAPGLFQAAGSFSDRYPSIGKPLLLYVLRFFIVILLFSSLYIVLSFVNLRVLFRRYYPEPGMTVSLLIATVTIGIALVCWFTCGAIIDQMTPQFINFR